MLELSIKRYKFNKSYKFILWKFLLHGMRNRFSNKNGRAKMTIWKITKNTLIALGLVFILNLIIFSYAIGIIYLIKTRLDLAGFTLLFCEFITIFSLLEKYYKKN